MRGAGWVRKRRLVRAAVALAGAVSIWLVLVPPAEASWTPVSNVGPAGWRSQPPRVVADRQGDFMLVWSACDPSTWCPYHAQARMVPRGGPMGPIMTLSTGQAWWLAAASDDAGDSAVVWEAGPQSGRAKGVRISADGSVGPVRTLSPSPASGWAQGLQVASTPAGDALVAWSQYTSGGGYSMLARYFHKDGSLGPLLGLGSSDGFKPAVAIDRLGAAVVAWTMPNFGLVARRITPGHVSPLQTIMGEVADGRSGAPRIAVDEDGDAVICWWQSTTTTPGVLHVWARRWSHTGSLGTVLQLSSATHFATNVPAVAGDFAGDTVAVWAQQNSSGQMVVFGRRISATDTLGPITYLGMGDYPAVTMDDHGDGLAVWQTPGPAPTNLPAKVYGREISQTGGFGPKTLLSSDGFDASTASTPSGDFSVIWHQSTPPWPLQARFGP